MKLDCRLWAKIRSACQMILQKQVWHLNRPDWKATVWNLQARGVVVALEVRQHPDFESFESDRFDRQDL